MCSVLKHMNAFFILTKREFIQAQILSLIQGKASFDETAGLVFDYQCHENPVYGQFTKSLGRQSYAQVPFLPVEFFKSHTVQSGKFEAQTVFSSSGTTGQITSRHFIRDLNWYETLFKETFRISYGNPEDFCFICLLPSYLERQGSSLVYMAEKLIQGSRYPQSGFYLNAGDEMLKILDTNRKAQIPTILLGVSFALLDMAEKYLLALGEEVIVMETGGMKGKRKELIREELHAILCNRLGVTAIHSEYGMTELMSQAYSKGKGLFSLPPQMKIVITEVNDPFCELPRGKAGTINIIDLGNLDSCAFIATKDLGKIHADGSLEILGRYDHSDVRGCNLLIA